MSPLDTIARALRAAPGHASRAADATAARVRASRPRHRIIAGAAATVAVAALAVGIALAPPGQRSDAEQLQAYIAANAQTFSSGAEASATPTVAARDAYAATPGAETLKAGGTNADWAKLVLLYGGWPQSDENVTVILRWMRQENYTDTWWNRNNPLNNGWGSGGNAGTGSYANLDVAAQKVAETLHNGTAAGYANIVAAFAASSATATTESAIWNANWAMSHYEYGAHWSYADVPVVTAPASAWG